MTTATLSKTQIKYLKTLAHGLKPIIRVGQQGLTDGVRRELDIALEHHELVKIKISAADRDARLEMLSSLCETSRAQIIQKIGSTATVFRRHPKSAVIDLNAIQR